MFDLGLKTGCSENRKVQQLPFMCRFRLGYCSVTYLMSINIQSIAGIPSLNKSG